MFSSIATTLQRIILTAAVLTLLTIAPGGTIAPANAVSESQDLAQEYWTAPSTPIQAVLSIDSYPPVGQPATLTCEISSVLDAPGTTAQIELPEGAQLLSGDLSWNGDLWADQPINLMATIAFDTEGDMAIFCRAHRVVDAENSWGDLAALYLSIEQTQSLEGFAPVAPEDRLQSGELVEAGDGQTIDESAVPSAPLPQDRTVEPPPAVAPSSSGEASLGPTSREATRGTLTVTGRWGYYDRDDNYTGALEFIVELVRGDNYNHLAWCYTDLSGYYSCGPVTNPESAGVRTIMWSYTSYNPYDDVLVVVNPDWGTSASVDYAFGTQTGVSVFSDGTHDIGSWVSTNGSTYERAYWVQRDLNDTWRFIWFGTGSSQSPQETSGPSTVEWKIDSTHGTHYHHGGNIHLKGEDPLSSTVVGHEYGHNIMWTVYGDWMPTTYCPTPHYIQLSSHVNCAWTEGWANFLPLAVNNEPVYYWASGSSLNLENPTWGTSGWDEGDDVEGRVAGAQWDILDTNNEGDDQYSDGGIVNIWDTLYHQNDSNFSEYWSAWKSRGHNNTSAGPVMCIFQCTIDYRNGPANDDFDNATVIGSLPFVVVNLNTANATTQGNDPNTSCGSTSTPKQSRSVWYRYTPATTGNYIITTNGSNYDTVLALWTGSFGSLTDQGCDDDGGSGTQSSLTRALTGGTTYYIEAMRYSSGSGGLLNLSVQVALPGAFSKSSPTNGATGQPTNPTLSWDSSSGADSYEYCIDTTNNSTCDGSWTNVGSNTSVGLSGLNYDTPYYWQVRARNAAGTTEADGGTWWHFTTFGGGDPTGDIVINELDVGDPDAVELYNADSQAINMTGWNFIAYSSGGSVDVDYTFPSFTLQPGAYVVLHETSGTDTATDLYMNDSIGWVNDGSGAAALIGGDGNGTDFVRFGGSTVSPPAGTNWTGSNPAGPPSGQTLGRDSASSDTDDGSDWCSQTPTLGAQNLGCGQAQWTLLVYLDGDNNLEGASIGDFMEMSSVGSNSDVNIVVQFDRIPGHDSSYGDWTDTRRFYVTPGMEPWDYNGVSIGEANMGDPQTLIDFVQWGVTNYPADRYAVIIWDHGSGWRLRAEDQPLFKDVAFDDTSGDALDMPELRSAMDTLSNGGADPLDLVGFDACLMAMIEVDNQLIPYADVRVGSEETEPGDGWPFDTILSALVGNPAMSASQLGTVIVDEYYASYGNSQTQSAVDLHSPYDTLNTVVSDFAVALSNGVGSYYSDIVSARSSTQEFFYPTYIDLYDFAYQVNQHVTDATINAAATDVMNAVNNAVIREQHGSGWPGAHGISIYFPESEGAYDSTYDGSQGWLQFTVNTQWDEWLHAFYDNVVCNDPHEPNDAPGQATPISYGTTLSDPDICPAGDVDYYSFAGNAGDMIVADIDAQAIGSSLDSYLYLYDCDGVTELTYNDDYDGLDSHIEYTLPADCTYYLMVREFNHPNEGGPDYFYTISLSLMAHPDIDVAPPSFYVTLPPDDSTTEGMTIYNLGYADLIWDIDEAPAPASPPPAERTDDGGSAERMRNLKEEQPTEGGSVPSLGLSNPTAAPTESQLDSLPAARTVVVQDGGFEAGTPNPSWTESSTNFGTPLCDAPSCGTGTGTGPHSGAWWAWFGGISTYEEGSVSQLVTIPSGSTQLEFYLEQIVCDSPADYLEVLIDGNQVFYTDGSSPLCGSLGYTQQTVNIGAYADDGSHSLEFHSEIFANNGGGTNFFVDDVSIPSGPPSNLLNDGSFENGPPPASAWTETADNTCEWIGDWSGSWGVAAYHGTYDYWGGGYCGSVPSTSSVEQSITVPPGGVLSFWYITYRPDVDDPPDTDTAYISVNGTNVWTLDLIQANDTYPNWANATVDLSAYGGQTVNLKLGANSVGAQTGNVRFDYLEWSSASGCDAPSDIPWLSVSPTGDTTPPSGSTGVNVTFDSTSMTAGDYEALLCVNSNDPDEPLVIVPATLHVEDVAPHDHWGEGWSGSGTGLTLESSDGTGSYGEGAWIGVLGYSASSSGRGVYGSASAASGEAYGVEGRSEASGGYGVWGVAGAASGEVYGVEGHSASSSGRGVYGYASAPSGTNYGVVGASSSPSGRGVYGYAAASSGTTYGIYGETLSPDGWAGAFSSPNGNGVYISVPPDKAGLLVASGSYNGAVPTADGARLLYAEEATEVWFADYGVAQLQDGVAVVSIDPTFAQTVNLGEPYHVFVQAYGDAELFVSQRLPEAFEVRLLAGDPDVTFFYRLVGKRLGHEGQRLERALWADGDPNLFPEQPSQGQVPDVTMPPTIPQPVPSPTELLDAYGAHSQSGASPAVVDPHTHWGETWSGSGTGLSLTSSDSYGFVGWAAASSGAANGVMGVSESTDGSGVYGSSALSGGVIGYSASTAGSGVYGYADASSGETYGVAGRSDASGGYALYGEAGATSGGAYGVSGVSESTSGRGVYGLAGATSGVNLAIWGATVSPDGWAGGFFSDYGNGVYVSVPPGNAGVLVTGGTKNGVVPTADGARLLYAEEASEVWFADYGFGQLKNKVAVVSIDRVFAQTVNLKEPYHVFLQVYGDAAVYVSQRTPQGFKVRLRDADAEPGVAFSYRVVAKGRGHEGQRLERAPWADADPNLSLEQPAEGEAQGESMAPPAPEAVAPPAGVRNVVHEGIERADHDHWGASWSGSGAGLFLVSTDSTGLYGHGEAYGIEGRSEASGGFGVHGYAAAPSGEAYGVMGHSASSSGSGVYGYGSTSSGATYGVIGYSASTGGRGMYGYASASSGEAYGVMGVSESTGGRGVLGFATATSGETYGIYGETRSPDGWAGAFVSDYGHGVLISVPPGKAGLMVASGSKPTAVATADGARMLYVEEATEVWFADYGFGQLQDGVAVVPIDPVFAQTVNLEQPYHVSLQVYGDAALYVSQRTPQGFEVRLRDADADAEAAFSYRLIAKRLGHEGRRLERVPWADDDPNLYPEQGAQGEAQEEMVEPIEPVEERSQDRWNPLRGTGWSGRRGPAGATESARAR